MHAFENTTQNFFQTTTLERGVSSGSAGEDAGQGGGTMGQGVQCSACFTIRRDVSSNIGFVSEEEGSPEAASPRLSRTSGRQDEGVGEKGGRISGRLGDEASSASQDWNWEQA